MTNMGMLGKIAWVLLIIGGLNWLVFGLFKLDIVAMILGDFTMLSRLVYILVGLSAVYVLYGVIKKRPNM